MARTGIVTDSTSGLNPEDVRPLGIAIAPIHVKVGARTYHEGVDLWLPGLYQLLSADSATVHTSPPSVREFREMFRSLAKASDEILAVLVSGSLSGTVNVACQAAQAQLGRARATVFDSRLTAAPLGWLAVAAAEAAGAGVDSQEIIRLLRAMVPRMYIAFYSKEPAFLRREAIGRRPAQTPKATAVEPLLLLEEGQVVPLERSRSRGRVVDRLYEFVTEFGHLERVAVLQGKPSPEAIELAAMITEAMPELQVETLPYSASILAHVGPDALGVAVYEGLT